MLWNWQVNLMKIVWGMSKLRLNFNVHALHWWGRRPTRHRYAPISKGRCKNAQLFPHLWHRHLFTSIFDNYSAVKYSHKSAAGVMHVEFKAGARGGLNLCTITIHHLILHDLFLQAKTNATYLRNYSMHLRCVMIGWTSDIYDEHVVVAESKLPTHFTYIVSS